MAQLQQKSNPTQRAGGDDRKEMEGSTAGSNNFILSK